MIRADGRTSWFNDTTTATGDHRTPGIAVWNRHTLGGYWWVKYPNQRSPILKQIDMGPDPSLNRTVDTHENALQAAGYTGGNYPTDARVQAVFLGFGAGHAARQAIRLGLRVTPGGAAYPQGGTGLAIQRAREAPMLDPAAVLGQQATVRAPHSGLSAALRAVPSVTLPAPPVSSQGGLDALLRRTNLV